MTKISFYNSLPPKGQPHVSDGEMTMEEFISNIKFGKWRDIVQPVRNEHDKEKRDHLKRTLVSVTVSGIFSERREASIISHSGFICIDVDNFTDKSQIVSDQYTYACFDSVSGLGFAVIIKVDPKKHKESFRFIQKYYFENYGIVVDPAPQNVASIRFVSFDPAIQINEKSKRSLTYQEPKRRPGSLPIILTTDNVSQHIIECQSHGIDIAPTYSDYLNLSFALVDGFGEQGRSYFHALCAVNAKYDSRHADKQYDIAIKRGQTGISVGTFYYMLKSAGIKIKPESTRAISIAAMGKKAGRTAPEIARQLSEINGILPESAASLVNEVFSRNDITLSTISKDPEHLIESLIEYISQNHSLRRNSILNVIEENGVAIKSDRMNTIYLRARAAFNMGEVNFDLINRMVYSDFVPSYNPITEYIERNSWRKSTGNILAIRNTINSSTPGGAVFLYKWMLGIIAVYHGQPVRYRLALVGKGRTGKTQWFRRFLPADLKRYYGESSLEAGKDDELLMCQKLILMDDELGGKNKVDEKRIKNLTSKDYFSLRAPYARQNEDFKRLAILCGTSNETDIVSDRTGNTRLLVIEVESINHAAYNEIDKDELFMELYRTYQESGEECWYLTEEENSVLSDSSIPFTEINYEHELISKYFYAPETGGLEIQMTAVDIKNHIESHSKQTVKSLKYFGIELKKFFGPAKRTNSARLYSVIQRPT